MLKSLKNRILAFFILLAITIGFTVFPLNYTYHLKLRSVQKRVTNLYELKTSFLQDQNSTHRFLSHEATEGYFFQTGICPSLEEHHVYRSTMEGIMEAQKYNGQPRYVWNDSLIRTITASYSLFCTTIDSLTLLLQQRGAGNTGLLGTLQHIEDRMLHGSSLQHQALELIQLRRNYQYSGDDSLSTKLLSHIVQLQSRTSGQDAVSMLLIDYKNQLDQLIRLNEKIGFNGSQGLLSQLNLLEYRIENDIDTLLICAREAGRIQEARLNALFGILAALLFMATLGLSVFLSRFLALHLEKLTGYISELATNDFHAVHSRLSMHRSTTEIRQIYLEFRNLVAQLRLREKQRDQALQNALESEHRYRELTDLLPQSVFETDRLGNIEYANNAWYKAFGYHREDVKQGLNLIEILQSHTQNNLFGIDKVENSDYVAIRKDGERFAALVYADNIYTGNSITGRRGIIIDATLRNKYIESLQRETVRAINSDKQKSSFLANMSHEIRTPMNSILGFANLLAMANMPEEQKGEFVEHIQSSGKILLNLIDDIIDIAKIEAGEIKIKPDVCQPARVIEELLNTFEGYKAGVGKGHIDLISKIPSDPMEIRTDPYRLRQILSNLTSNAIKFTDEGTVTISFVVKNEQWIEFSVEDTGMGLTQEELRKVFTRFQRTARSEEKNISGTGLGLAISKNLVELLGGQMWVSSVPNQGTRFWFHLPYAPVAGSGHKWTPTEFAQDYPQFNWNRKTILVAEDDDNSYTLLKSILTPTQARILRAVNGREAIEAVKITDAIDLILMDIQMPFINGIDATREIKKLRPTLPVIAQTASAMDGDKEKCILAGCDDYLTKPIHPENLLAKMSQFIPSAAKTNASSGSALSNKAQESSSFHTGNSRLN